MTVAEISIDSAFIGAILTLAGVIGVAILNATYLERQRQRQKLLTRKAELREALYSEMGRIIGAIYAVKENLKEWTISSLGIPEEDLFNGGAPRIEALAPIETSHSMMSLIQFDVHDFARKDPLLYYKLGNEALWMDAFYAQVKVGIEGYDSTFQAWINDDATRSFWDNQARLDEQPDCDIEERKRTLEAFFKQQNDYMQQSMEILERSLTSALHFFKERGREDLKDNVNEAVREYITQLLS
jgi:hypothetical protein